MSIENTMNADTSESRSLLIELGMLYFFHILSNTPFNINSLSFIVNPKKQKVSYEKQIDTYSSRFT